MVEPMIITKDMRIRHEERVDEIVTSINSDIARAVKYGCNKTYFGIDKDDAYYQEVRKIFERAGYTIKPTGDIGGVLQTTEDICW